MSTCAEIDERSHCFLLMVGDGKINPIPGFTFTHYKELPSLKVSTKIPKLKGLSCTYGCFQK